MTEAKFPKTYNVFVKEVSCSGAGDEVEISMLLSAHDAAWLADNILKDIHQHKDATEDETMATLNAARLSWEKARSEPDFNRLISTIGVLALDLIGDHNEHVDRACHKITDLVSRIQRAMQDDPGTP